MEEWRLIKGFGGSYEVSNLGNIRSVERLVLRTNPKNKNEQMYFTYRSRIIKPYVTKKGYLRVRLQYDKKGKGEQIHRLVAIAFIDNNLNKPQVNHINGIKTDNRVENLEWVSNMENWLHSALMGKQRLINEYGFKKHISEYL